MENLEKKGGEERDRTERKKRKKKKSSRTKLPFRTKLVGFKNILNLIGTVTNLRIVCGIYQ